MTDIALHRLRSVQARQGYRLALVWEHGSQSVVDLSDMVSRGGVFEALSDQKKFAAVRIGENRRVVEWPDPKDDLGYPVIEIDANALRHKALIQEDARLAATMRKARDSAARKLRPAGAEAKSRG